MESLTDIVREYYQRVDTTDGERRLLIPSSAGAGEECHELREIGGSHILEQVWQAGPGVVMALGEFDAIEASGTRCRVRFVDVWRFDADRRVERRQTFLSLGPRCGRA